MFKKRALLLFFAIISIGLFSDDSPMEIVSTAYESQPKTLTTQGVVEVEDETYPVTITIKNRELFKTDIEIVSETEIDIPKEILNYEFINREFSLLRSISFKKINSYRVQISKPELEEESEEAELIELDDFPFKKVIYTVTNYPRLLAKREYFKEKDDRDPALTFEAQNILHINGYHLVTSFLIKDIKNSKEWLIKLNIETLDFGESR